jgi:hypothetical protein
VRGMPYVCREVRLTVQPPCCDGNGDGDCNGEGDAIRV